MKIYSLAGADVGRALRVPFFKELFTVFVRIVRRDSSFDSFLYFCERVWFPFLYEVGALLLFTFADGSPWALLGQRTPVFFTSTVPFFPRRWGGTYAGISTRTLYFPIIRMANKAPTPKTATVIAPTVWFEKIIYPFFPGAFGKSQSSQFGFCCISESFVFTPTCLKTIFSLWLMVNIPIWAHRCI